MSRCIINVAVGSWFPRGQARLRRTLRDVGYRGDLLFWTDELPPGCPSHDEVPYAFKAHALEMARACGYGPVVWADASSWFLRDPEPLFARIKRDGYYLWQNPLETFGECAADATVEKLGIDREESFGVPSAVTTIFGIDLQSAAGAAILDRFARAARDGTFCAPWGNVPDGPPWHPGLRDAHGSRDPRVKACRHDQAAMSGIAHLLNLKLDDRVPAQLVGYPSAPHAETVIALAEDDGGASLDAWERTGWLKR